jgi:hypothetical protein
VALDIHIVANPDQTPVAMPACSIDESVHAELFGLRAVGPTNTPRLWRMHDYYADARYVSGELVALADEITAVIPQLSKNARSTLSEIVDACKRAEVNGMHVVCWCD